MKKSKKDIDIVKQSTPKKNNTKKKKSKILIDKKNSTSNFQILAAECVFLYLFSDFLCISNLVTKDYSYFLSYIEQNSTSLWIFDFLNFIECNATQKLCYVFFSFLIVHILSNIGCEIDLSFIYALTTILDPNISGYLQSSNVISFQTFVLLLIINNLQTRKFSFQINKVYFILSVIFSCYLNVLSLLLCYEYFSIVLFQTTFIIIRMLYLKKGASDFKKISMLFSISSIFFLLFLLFGHKFKKPDFQFISFVDFIDELKFYNFPVTFFINLFASLAFSFTSNLNKLHKTLLLSLFLGCLYLLFIPIQMNDYSIQIRLYYINILVTIFCGIIINCSKYYSIAASYHLILFVLSLFLKYQNTEPF